mgnify:CR=1 FL=1
MLIELLFVSLQALEWAYYVHHLRMILRNSEILIIIKTIKPMEKKHVSPEFTVIKQDEANAKFFVASFENEQLAGSKTTSSVASNYSGEDNVDDLW